MYVLYRGKNNDKLDLDNFKAVILIDELELYLHLSTQEKLLKQLEIDFPNLNLIYSTHSPFIIQRSENCLIYEIDDRNLVKIDQENYFLDMDSIITYFFEVERFPKDILAFSSYLDKIINGDISFNNKEYSETIYTLREKYKYLSYSINDLILNFLMRADECDIKLD